MGPLGVPELIIIFIVALVVFGPRKLPELGRSLGKSLSEFKRASNELRNTLDEEIQNEDRRAALSAPATTVTPAPQPAAESVATHGEPADEYGGSDDDQSQPWDDQGPSQPDDYRVASSESATPAPEADGQPAATPDPETVARGHHG